VTAVVLDASAVLALIFDETGADKVLPLMGGALISAVNFSEVVAKLADLGVEAPAASAQVASLGMTLVAFDEAQATAAAALRPLTRHLGLSLGDLACLALASARGVPAVTADRVWQELGEGWRIETIR
jgi:ribonuclease VapC